MYRLVISPFFALFAPIFGVGLTVNDLPKKPTEGIASIPEKISESPMGIGGWAYFPEYGIPALIAGLLASNW